MLNATQAAYRPIRDYLLPTLALTLVGALLLLFWALRQSYRLGQRVRGIYERYRDANDSLPPSDWAKAALRFATAELLVVARTLSRELQQTPVLS